MSKQTEILITEAAETYLNVSPSVTNTVAMADTHVQHVKAIQEAILKDDWQDEL